MTIGNDASATSRQQAIQAAELLDVSLDQPLSEIKSQLLRQVAADRFMPQRSTQGAFAAVLPKSDVARFHGLWQEDQDSLSNRSLRSQVKLFTKTFFRLPVGERQRRWTRLRQECKSDVRLFSQMQRLHSGLDVTPVPEHSLREVNLLIGYLLELFLLPPARRAARRWEIIDQIVNSGSPQRRQWKIAVRKMERAHPNIVKLDRELMLGLRKQLNSTWGIWRHSDADAQVMANPRRYKRQKNVSGLQLIALAIAALGVYVALMQSDIDEQPRPPITSPDTQNRRAVPDYERLLDSPYRGNIRGARTGKRFREKRDELREQLIDDLKNPRLNGPIKLNPSRTTDPREDETRLEAPVDLDNPSKEQENLRP